jgi:hypothetical protein
MKKVILIATIIATPSLADGPSSPWDRPTLTPPISPPTLTVRVCDEDFQRVNGLKWLRVKTGKIYTLHQRKRFERRCRPVRECTTIRFEVEDATPRFQTKEICK